jgi:hypothetical protein
MGFVIELTHKKGGPPRYICAVPATTDEYENTPVETLAEARRYPYATTRKAQRRKNICR